MTTRTVALTCNQCGAAISAGEDVRFLTCDHCGTRLEIERSEGAVYTKVLEAVERATQKADEAIAEVEQLKRGAELAQVDAELARVDAALAKLATPMTVAWPIGFFIAALIEGLILSRQSGVSSGDRAGNFIAGFLLPFGIIGIVCAWLVRGAVPRYEARKQALDSERAALVVRRAKLS